MPASCVSEAKVVRAAIHFAAAEPQRFAAYTRSAMEAERVGLAESGAALWGFNDYTQLYWAAWPGPNSRPGLVVLSSQGFREIADLYRAHGGDCLRHREEGIAVQGGCYLCERRLQMQREDEAAYAEQAPERSAWRAFRRSRASTYELPLITATLDAVG